MVGHAWPLFAGFRGGRGVATFGGAAAVHLARSTAAAAISAGAVVGRRDRLQRRRGIQAGFVAYPVVQLAVDGPRRTAATGAADVVHRAALLDGPTTFEVDAR